MLILPAMKTRHLTSALVAAAIAVSASAQSNDFRLGQWVEIENAILKELNDSYVDSLPLGRIQLAGIDAMLENLDPYTEYVPEEDNEDFEMMIGKTYGGIGAVIYKPSKEVNVVINEPYANSPAVRSGLVCGDEILEIDGETVRGLVASECSEKMRGTPGTDVHFKVVKLRSKDTVMVTVRRERIHLPDVEYAGMLDDTTGYVYQSGFTEGVSDAVRSSFNALKAKGMKKFVLDLRGNGGGLMKEAIDIVSLFVPKGSLVLTQKGKEGTKPIEYHTTMEPLDTDMPMVVLIDGGTASSSEIVSGALQDLDRATIMGRRSYGKGLVQSVRPMPYNGKIKVTTAKYYTPSGRCVQAIDYAKRGEDGSVSPIPDSLTHEFKTAHGRSVRDGGGITPDVEVPVQTYSRLVYSLVYSGVTDNYAIHFVRNHPSIPAVDEFHFDEYDDFVAYAQTQEFDYRSEAKTLFDEMRRQLSKDGLEEGMRGQLDSLAASIDLDKSEFLWLMKDQIVPFIEEEIAVRYYYQEAGIRVRLRYDTQLREAMKKALIKF